MNCEQFEAMVHDWNRRALEESSYTLARLHAETCASCAARLAQAKSLTAGLQALATSEAGDGAPPRVEAMLRSAFLRQQWAMARGKSMRRWTAAGIAAALLLSAALALRPRRRSVAPQHVAYTAPVTAAAPTLPVPLPAVAAAGGASRTQSHPARQTPAAATQSDDEFVGDFVPYPAGGSILPFESGQIVRVQMPGATLVAMGYPVGGDHISDRFTADLLFGEDGLPRAIRLVR